MFFGRATAGFAGLFSTHPPIAERIRRIEPSWDGALPEVASGSVSSGEVAGVSSLAGGGAGRHARAGLATAMDYIGRPSEAHIGYAAHLLRSLPPALVNAAHEPYGARALVYALLLNDEEGPRQAQLARLAAAADPGVFAETRTLRPVVSQLDVRARLPLVDISLPALRALTSAQYDTFRQNVDALVRADEQIDLFEWSLHRILLHDLEARRATAGARRIRHHSVASVQAPCELLLSMLAYAGARTLPAATNAFDQARLALELPQARLYPSDDCHLDALDDALAELDDAAPQVKRLVLRAAVASIAADRQVTASEAELLRAISASLGVPMPPILAA